MDKQVNLVNADGLTLNYGATPGPRTSAIDGGSGTWRVGGAGTSDKTNTAGTVNAAWSQGAAAGQGGNVKVDSATDPGQGMQFAANGYTLVNNAGRMR